MVRYLLFFFVCISFAAGLKANDQFDKAVLAYQEDRFEESLELFASLELSGLRSAGLFFNLANCHLKLNHLAKSILYYERALKLKPNLRDAKLNLEKAKTHIKEEVVPTNAFFLQSILNKIIWTLSASAWLFLSVLFLCLAVFFYFMYVQKGIKPLGYAPVFWIGLSIVMAIVVLVFAYEAYDYRSNQDYAIYMKTEGTLMQSPSALSEKVLPISAGLKCLIMDDVDGWILVRLEDYQQGWIKQEDLDII